MDKVDFVDGNNGFTLMYPDKILSTTNGGALWSPQVITGTSLNSLSFVSPLVGWVLDYNYGSVYKTENGGLTWVMQYTNPFTGPSYDIHFVDESYGWVQRNDRTLFTTDGGVTWDSVPSPGGGSSVFKIQFFNATDGYCLNTNNTLYKSSDGGHTWIPKTIWSGPGYMNSFFALDENMIWAIGDNGLIRHSQNGGDTWITQNSGISTSLKGVVFYDSFNGIIAGIGGTILSTSDGGTTWITNISGAGTDLYSLEMVSAGEAWVTGSSGVILNSYANTDLQTEAYVGEDSVCSGDLTSIIVVAKNHGTSPITAATFSLSDLSGNLFDFNWTGNMQPGQTETIDIGYISSTQSQNYTVAISGDAIVTNNTYTFFVEQLVAPNGIVSGPHTICQGDSVQISVSGGISYEWINNSSNDASIYVQPTDASSLYIVKVFDQYNCINYDTVQVFLNSASNGIASGPHEYCAGDSVQISVSGGVTYEWLNIASTNSTLYVTPDADTNEYFVVIYDTYNCKSYDTVFVVLSDDCEPPVFANLAFSPNGDLKNDYLYLDGLDSNSNTVTIYSRWGDELATILNYDNVNVRWDGMSNGQLCPQGTYYYVVEIATTNHKLVGWIQLVY
ncbi:MAG: gliding motility-associated C-terminal domain-containing protein [Crocinitomicaceae bacterium]|nr:gliding motility-associated C-terminal domain-containing protein [Crocinitomicaceae bacterium]